MSHAPSDDFKELVRARTDLVSLVGESVTLHARGREFVGLCPFHDDHNPSMRVSPERQSFRCWSCNTGGDCFSFIMLRDRVEFPEALERFTDAIVTRYLSNFSTWCPVNEPLVLSMFSGDFGFWPPLQR